MDVDNVLFVSDILEEYDNKRIVLKKDTYGEVLKLLNLLLKNSYKSVLDIKWINPSVIINNKQHNIDVIKSNDIFLKYLEVDSNKLSAMLSNNYDVNIVKNMSVTKNNTIYVINRLLKRVDKRLKYVEANGKMLFKIVSN